MPASNLPFRVLVITDRRVAKVHGGLVPAVEECLRHGGEGVAVMLRDKDLPTPERQVIAERLRPICRAAGALLLIHGDPGLAARVDADGIHVPDSPAGRDLLSRADSNWVLGASCHSHEGLTDARAAGAHYATLSPILPSPGKGSPIGFGALNTPVDLPVFALGGLGATHADLVRGAGGAGVAGIRAFMGAGDVAGAVRSCREAFA